MVGSKARKRKKVKNVGMAVTKFSQKKGGRTSGRAGRERGGNGDMTRDH